jgi:hypothetical protein
MATIVKTNYCHADRGGLKAAVGSVYYYAHRRDREGQVVERFGFSREQEGLNAQQMSELIQQGDGQYFYRMVLSPGAEKDSDVDLREWTRDTLLELEEKYDEFPYVAIEHRDQTDHAHVHVVAVLDKKLDRDDLESLRDVGSELYDMQREWYEPSLSQAREPEKHQSREMIAYSEGFIAGYQDEPEESIKQQRRDKSKSLDR